MLAEGRRRTHSTAASSRMSLDEGAARSSRSRTPSSTRSPSLPPAVRRRPRGNAEGARPGREVRRDDRRTRLASLEARGARSGSSWCGSPCRARAWVGNGWHEVGAFLGPSIREATSRRPLPRVLGAWRAAGIEDVQSAAQPRGRRGHLGKKGGTARVLRPASAGGATTSRSSTCRTRCGTCPTSLSAPRWLPTSTPTAAVDLAAFALALGNRGPRPRRDQRPTAADRHPDRRPRCARRGIACRCVRDRGLRRLGLGLGAHGVRRRRRIPRAGLQPRWLGGVPQHLGFGLAWGAFRVLTAFFAQALTVRPRRSSAAGFASRSSWPSGRSPPPSARPGATVGTLAGIVPSNALSGILGLGLVSARRRARRRTATLTP